MSTYNERNVKSFENPKFGSDNLSCNKSLNLRLPNKNYKKFETNHRQKETKHA